MDRLTFQIERIKAILADDKNYQVDSLKIGAIWDICDRTASYKRGKDISGRDFIEVLPPGQSLSQEAVREEALSGIIDELAAIADACVDLQQNRKRPDSDPVMSWDNAPLTLGTLRKARALKREPNAAGQAGQNEFRTAPSIEVNSPFERVPQHDTKMTTDMELAGEIERYLAPDAIYYQWMPSMADMEQIIAALRQSALAQTEIKGHMRVEDELKVRIAELEEALAGVLEDITRPDEKWSAGSSVSIARCALKGSS